MKGVILVIFGVIPFLINTNYALWENDINLEDSGMANVTSPSYPDNYEDNADMLWRVIAPSGYRVMLHFKDLKIDDVHDYVTVYEGRTPTFEEAVQRSRISGYTRPLNITSVGSYLWLRFTSDADSNSKGFKALLSYISIHDIFLTIEEAANITSPNYPNQYDNNADILWKVTAPSGYRVVLNFKNFTTQQHKDNVTVFEGRAPELEKSVMRIHESGSTIPSNITSVGSYLWLRFISDGQSMLGTHTGFSAQLLLDDIPVIDLTITETANLSSPQFPNQYDNNIDILWKVEAQTGNRVVVTFVSFNTESGNDFVTLFEGRSPDFKESMERKKLSGSPRLDSFTSIGSYMWLRFTSDRENGIVLLSPGFEAMLSYITIREITLENPETVAEVTSPNFPLRYNNYDDILWRVKAPADYRVLLHFNALDIEPEYDYVTIYEGRVPDLEKSTKRSRNSGYGTPLNITSIGSYLWIRFTSDRNYQADGSITYTGFRVLLSSVPIPGILLTTSDTANLTSPKFPYSYDSDTDILWKVIAPSGEGVRIAFSVFYTKSGYDFVTIYEGRTNEFEEAVERSKLSGSSLPDNITSIGSYVWLRFTSAGELQSCTSCSGFMAIIGTVPIRGLESQSTTSPVIKTSVPTATLKTNFKEVIVIASIGSSVALFLIGIVILAVFMCHRKRSKTSKTLSPSSPGDESADTMYRNPVYGADGDSKDYIIGCSAAWSCSFGSFEQSVPAPDEPCSICLAEKDSQPFFWFVTDSGSSFGETQPYFRAALNNPNNSKGVSAECTLLNASLPSGGLLSFRYIFNSRSRNETHGYFNYSVCKDEGIVHPLNVVEGWALRQHSFNCSDVEITFKAVRGNNFSNVGIDDVDLVQPGNLTAGFNAFNLSSNQSEVSLTKELSGRRVRITFSWQYQGEHDGRADLFDVLACENRTLWTPDPERARNQNSWYNENISFSCDSYYFSITFKAKMISPDISVLLDDIQIYDISVHVVEQTGSTSPQGGPIPRYILYVASSVAATCLLLAVIIAIFFRRKCRSRSKPASSQESDVDDTGLVINELYDELSALPSASDILVDGDHAPSSSMTPPDTIVNETNADNDMGNIAGDGHGGSACRSAHYKTTCDDITYHTLEVPTKDGCTIYQGQENTYADVEDNRFGVFNVGDDLKDTKGDEDCNMACRSNQEKTSCDGNTYYTLEAPTRDLIDKN